MKIFLLALCTLCLCGLILRAAQQHINYGAAANDKTGDSLRTAFSKSESNFNEIYLSGVTATNILVRTNGITSGANIATFNFTGYLTSRVSGVTATIGPSIDSQKLASMRDTEIAVPPTPFDFLTFSSIDGGVWLNSPLGVNPNQFSKWTGSLVITQGVTLTNAYSVGNGADLDHGAQYYGWHDFRGTNVHYDKDIFYSPWRIYSADYDPAKYYEFTHFVDVDLNSNSIARLGDVTNIVRSSFGVQLLNSNTVLTIDLNASSSMALMRTAPGNYNLTVIVTNAAAGRSRDFSILGPAGSNSVTFIWEPWVLARWPTDPYTLLPVTNTYIATNCYLECSVKVYATNDARISAALFK